MACIYRTNGFRKCKSPKEAYELALTVADGYMLEEFQDVMTQIHDAVTKFGEGELSKEDLAKVSGGTDGWEIAGYTIVGTLTVGGLGTVLATMAV